MSTNAAVLRHLARYSWRMAAYHLMYARGYPNPDPWHLGYADALIDTLHEIRWTYDNLQREQP